jgi:DNA polymerase III sliding clamp (beta) subunit (PCNA family)
MKISIEKQELLKHLKTSVGLLESLNTNPTMDCLLIEAKDKQLTIISSNNFSSLKNTTNKLTISTPGKVLVRGKIIYSIISKLKEKQINIELIDNKILRISTESFSSDINTEESSTYPSINFNFEN